MTLIKALLLLLIRLYQLVLSPIGTALLGPSGFGCRYEPTCSQYALEVIQGHGAAKGSLLALRRLCRCHPWGGFGYDPPPVPSQPPAPTRLLTPLTAGTADTSSSAVADAVGSRAG